MQTTEPLIAIGTFVLAAVFLGISSQYRGGGEVFPMVTAAIVMAASALLFLRAIMVSTPQTPMRWVEARRVGAAVILTVLYVAGIVYVGFVAASIIYIIGTAYSLGLRHHVAILATAAGFVFSVYFIFTYIFYTPLPQGFLGRLF